MMKTVKFSKKKRLSKPFFYENQEAVNKEEKITSDEDDPIDFGSNSQSLQATNILDNVCTRICHSRRRVVFSRNTSSCW